MYNCADCGKSVMGEPVKLKSGSALCPECFQKRFAGPRPPQMANVAAAGNYLGIGLTVAAIGLVVVVVYAIHSSMETARIRAAEAAKQAEAEEEVKQEKYRKAETEKARLAQALAEEEKKAQKLRDEELRKMNLEAARLVQEAAAVKNAEKLRQLEEKRLAQQQQDAQERLRQAELAETERRERFVQDRQAAVERQKKQGEAAELRRTVIELDQLVTRAETQRATDDRKVLALKNQFNTYRKTADSTPQHETTSTRIDNPRSSVTTFDADAIANNKQKEANENAAQNASDALYRLEQEREDHERNLQSLIDRREEARRKLAEMGETVAPFASGRAVAAADSTMRRSGFKTVFKKDGKTVQAQSVISTDGELRYKDVDGIWRTMKSQDVDRVESNP